MVWAALSFQDQVEKYGVYVGIAAFFGLAVLSLLYFSQARELKRLREWADAAPERAQELEQRVTAQASASAARRRPVMPGPPATAIVASPRRLAEIPSQPEAESAVTAQATEVADSVPEEVATNGAAPTGDGAAAAPAADEATTGNGAAPPDATQEHPAAKPEPEGESAEKPEEERGAAAQPADEVAAEPADAAPEPAEEAPPADQPTVVETPAGEEGAEPVAKESAAPKPPPVPGEIPPITAIPRATPAQRVGVSPRPAPMPLRQPKPSAVPASQRGAARRPGAPAAAGPARERRSGGTIALLIGLAVLLLGGGTFLASQLLGGDDTPAPPNRAAPPSTQAQTGGDDATGGSAPARTPPAETNVAVLNGTNFTGLAGQIADRVSQEGGYERGVTETNTRDQTLQTSTVYFADGFRPSARAVARMLSINDLEPLDAETAALAPGADVVVLAGADQAP